MNRRNVIKGAVALSAVALAGATAQEPLYRRIQISRQGSPFFDDEFEALQQGDIFQVVSGSLYRGQLYEVLAAAVPVKGEPGNWAVRVKRFEGFEP